MKEKKLCIITKNKNYYMFSLGILINNNEFLLKEENEVPSDFNINIAIKSYKDQGYLINNQTK